jgi:hypothetical protein
MRMLSAVVVWVLTLVMSVLQPSAQPADRFDMLVRADFFAGFAGDRERLAQGMAACEKVLAGQPSDAEALVWHGSGLAFQAGEAFGAGQQAHGTDLWITGMREVDRAVELSPNSVGVLIPRGAMLLAATRSMPAAMAAPLLHSALANYERVLELQQDVWPSLGDHEKGELLFGLAEGYARVGDMDRARRYFTKLVADAPKSGQNARARAFLSTGQPPALPQNGMTCIGCHQ